MRPPVTHHTPQRKRGAPRLLFLALIAGGAFALTGCSTPVAPEVTFFADGHAVNSPPLIHCDALVRDCQQSTEGAAKLKVRPGKPVQISVPSDIAKTPWVINVQYANAKGQLQPIKQQTFTSGDRFAYTATPPAPDDQLLVVEIQQLGAAYAADQSGKPIVDQAGNPQLVARAIWSLQVEPSAS
jgi:hypothetical protein